MINKININKWKEFVVGDLFDLVNSTAYHKKDVIEALTNDTKIAYVTRSKFNNGLNMYVKMNEKYNINPKNTISFGAENANFFYQPEEYITGNKMYYINTQKLNPLASLFIKTIFEKRFSDNYSFSDGMIPDRIRNKKIKLPADINGNPDWNFMEEYMKKIKAKAETSLGLLSNYNIDNTKCDTSEWKMFCLNDLFEANNTGNILSRDVIDGTGTTPYVTASSINNGVVAHIDATKYSLIKGNCILVGGKTFTLTYQANDFVSNDSHNFEMHIKDYEFGVLEYLYLISVIRSAFSNKYYWGDAVTKDKLMNEKILLPTLNGIPNWKYMKQYMQNILNKEKNKLELLNSI